jgi:hypothetical protein
MFCFLKMAAKFKMASIVKKSNFLLAVMFSFLGLFEQKVPFWTCHTQIFYIINKKIIYGTEIQDGVHRKKKIIFFWLSCTYFSADLNKINHFGLIILNSFILSIKKIKIEPKFNMASIVKKCNFLLAVMYLFLGRFEQINHFGLVILNSLILSIKKN